MKAWCTLVLFFFGIVLPIIVTVSALLLMSGCGGVDRQLCYASAEAVAWSQAEQQCFGRDLEWDACPERERILEELRQSYQRCP